MAETVTEPNPNRTTMEFGRAVLRNSILGLVDGEKTSPTSLRGSMTSHGNSSSSIFKTPCVVKKLSVMPPLVSPGLVSQFTPKPPVLLTKSLSFNNGGLQNVQQRSGIPSPTASLTASPTPQPKMDRREVAQAAVPKASPSGAVTKDFLKDGTKGENGNKQVNGQKKSSTQQLKNANVTNIQGETSKFDSLDGTPERTSKMRPDAPEFVLPVERKSEMRADAPEFMPMADVDNQWNYMLNGNFLIPVKLSESQELEVEEDVVIWRVGNVSKVELFSPSFWVAGVNAKLGIAYASKGICHVSLVCEKKTKLKFDVSVNGRRSGPKVCIGKQFSTTIKIEEDSAPRRIAFQALQLMQ